VIALASSRTNDGRRTVRRGFIIALVVVTLTAFSLGTGFAFSAFQLLVQTDATLRDLIAFKQIRQRASQGYDVREARAKWLESISAYQTRQFIKADGLANNALAVLKQSKRVGYRIYYTSSGDIKVSGLVFKPTRGGAPWPTVVAHHPGFGEAADFSDVALSFRDHGYLAFCPDYRGSGKSEGKPELAKGEVDDVINGILYLKSKGLIDDNRIGLFGQSHGAAVAMIVAGRYPEVKAVVEAAGFTDLASAYEYHTKKLGDPQIKKMLMSYYSVIGGTPEEVPQEYAVRSAVNYVSSIQAPILIFHGAKDPIVPVSQAEEMYQALRNAGKTVEMKIYPNEGHGVSDPRAQLEMWQMTFSWFEKYI
jgi:dipeptidyl aminopeptidase/acylaminoacyl peptidase